MSLSISRDLNDLTPKQPSIQENIDKVNKLLDKYGKELKNSQVKSNGEWEFLIWKYRQLGKPESMKDKLLDIVVANVLKQLGGGGIVEEIILNMLKTLMDETEIDDQIYARVANEMKEQIPGEKYEPLIGEVLEGLGRELKKPVE